MISKLIDQVPPKLDLVLTSAPARPLRTLHYLLLALPCLGLLWPPFYARWSPEILGIPFFYAYQFVWIFLSAALTGIVYRSIER